MSVSFCVHVWLCGVCMCACVHMRLLCHCSGLTLSLSAFLFSVVALFLFYESMFACVTACAD